MWNIGHIEGPPIATRFKIPTQSAILPKSTGNPRTNGPPSIEQGLRELSTVYACPRITVVEIWSPAPKMLSQAPWHQGAVSRATCASWTRKNILYFLKNKGTFLVKYPYGYIWGIKASKNGQIWPPHFMWYMFQDIYWMFAVQITECVFSLKSLGLLTPTHPQFRT